MKFSTLLCGAAALATSVSAIVTTGVSGGATGVRYEVRELKTSYPAQFTLLLLAMQQYQALPQTNATGYYQIAGIHGVPRVTYDGVAQCSGCAGSDGYCTHDSILFMPWHRSYLALFEQELVAIAKTIAASYPSSSRATYVAAAAKLRLPYWDWAAHPPTGQNTLPGLFTSPSVTLTTPTGSKTIANPLYQHTFTDPSAMVYSPFTTWTNTLRYPTSNAASATSNEATDVAAFNNIRASLQDRLYQLLTTCTTYSEIGLDLASTANAKCASSLEGLHNTIHTTSGGPAQTSPTKISGGHMTYLSTAGFDPIFWMHHAMVDRLFALWQAMYPSSYGATQANVTNPTWTIAKGSSVGPDSNLTPFHRDAGGDFWTTNLVKDHTVFGYTYPEFVDSSGSSAAINSYVNELYGPSATATAGSTKRTAAPEPGILGSVLSSTSTPLVANNGSLFQYVANIVTSRYALNGSYTIYLFNGEPTTTNSAEYLLDTNLIGPLGVLAMSMSGMDVTITGSIPLTRTLTNVVAAGSDSLLTDLTEALVVPYLKKNLKWIVIGPDGEKVNPKTIPDFDITVYASTATAPTTNALPVWSDFIPLEDVTKEAAAAVVSNIPGAGKSTTSTTSSAKNAKTTSAATTSTTSTSTTNAVNKNGSTKTTSASGFGVTVDVAGIKGSVNLRRRRAGLRR